ncbi:hypothetical protein ABL78_7591 [Leptomonas seymouri]|uniref:Uncharacterized protein n=1 Tax=Leptomonas seymouri TaxID=5684 RepID=A0A0N0P2U7_LEPSE|nr:hypothetical protein ABL78_7591 [Leptomonas seymouri]|eukprot:KPI83376.1 hypothetical protein ABL78_7591 [Leptomonas seymouri]
MRQLFLTTASPSPVRRGAWHRIGESHRHTAYSLQVAHRPVATSASPAADSAVKLFAKRLLAAPHRDVTHVEYGDWFTLYVGVRKGWRAKPNSTSESSVPSLEEQQHAKRAIDALLWSSLFARHWTEVQMHVSASPPEPHYCWWWHPEASLKSQSAALELCTSDFMTEPLLGGRYLQLWMEDVRSSSASADASNGANTSEVPTVVLPFSALWEVKRSAYWRPAASQSGAPPSSPAVAAAPPLSLQERQARQALLQTIDQLLQLQCDAATRSGQLQRICVLSPTEEWDLMCQAQRLRQALSSPASTAVSLQWLSIGYLCVDASVRLAYVAHLLNWQQQQQFASSDHKCGLTPVRILSPSTEHAHLRSYALTSVHEHSSAKAALDRRCTARHQQSPSLSSAAFSPGSGATAATVHGQARKGCSDAVRRMSTREENIRRSFSVQ